MKYRFEILPHPADLKIKAFGETKEELFLNMMFGMISSLEAEQGKENAEREIEVSGENLENLLINFLSRVLYLIQVNKETYKDIEFIEFHDKRIRARLLGKKAEGFRQDIKAVTYYDLEIKEKEDKTFEAVVVFDI